MKNSLDDISIVIVTFNSENVIENCVKHLLSNRDLIEIIIVDNASQDSTLQKVNLLPVKVIRNERNYGFAKSANIGAMEATRELICFLNPDCYITPHDILLMKQSLFADNSIGAISPKINNLGSGRNSPSQGNFPTLKHSIVHFLGLSKLAYAVGFNIGIYQHVRGNGFVETDWIAGTSIMLRTKDFTNYKFSEKWFLYSEDVDLCYRIRLDGKRVGVLQDCIVSHDFQMSSNNTNVIRDIWLRNLFDVYCINFNNNIWLHRLFWLVSASLGQIYRYFIFSWLALLRPDCKSHFFSKANSSLNSLKLLLHSIAIPNLKLRESSQSL